MVLPSSNPPTLPRWLQSRIPYPYVSQRFVVRALRILIPAALLVVGALFWFYEWHVTIIKYRRTWVETEINPVLPLAGCFEPDAVHADYNLTHALHGPRYTEVHAGVPMQLGLDCYDFAGTIQPVPHAPPRTTPARFHTYWRVDLAPFGPRQEWVLKSFLATQPPESSHLTIWSNGDLSSNPTIARYIAEWPYVFDTRPADVHAMARGTALEGSPLLENVFDSRAWVDGDVVRLLAIWQEGGAWIDMDTLLTRDFTPLLEHEFVTQWDCHGKVYQALNGAFMHFHKHSPYLCEAFHIMATSTPPRPSSTDWGAILYLKLWRRLVRAGIRPFAILPHCLTDAGACWPENSLPDPFEADPRDGRWLAGHGREEGGGLDQRLGKVFAIHLHNQWNKVFPEGGWVDRLLLRRYERTIAERKGEL